uniref:Secreted protein n=1 Tax=Phakopsora pachyrhizi TaxID=170000 RepID=A0A0S1MJ37_PHAPC
MNFVSSNVTLPDPSKKPKKKHNEMIVVQSVGAQIHCHSDVSSIDTSWMTLSKEISFYGSLFFQIEMKGENCNKPAELILDYSRCSYNLTMNNSRKFSGIPCDWKFFS